MQELKGSDPTSRLSGVWRPRTVWLPGIEMDRTPPVDPTYPPSPGADTRPA